MPPLQSVHGEKLGSYLPWASVSVSSVSRASSYAQCHWVACAPRSFVYRSRIDFFGPDFLLPAAKTSCEFMICSKRSTSGGNANEQCSGFEQQAGFLLPCVDRAGKQSQPGGKARPRAREIARSFDDKNAAIPHGRQIIPSLRHPQTAKLRFRRCEGVATRHDDDYFGLRRVHRFPIHTEGRFSLMSQHIDSARALHHFRHPMSRDVQRIEPFEAEH